MNHIDALELSWKHGADLVSGLRPGDLSAPTPCGDWDVRGLLNHTLGEAQMMTDVNRGLPSGNDHGDLAGDGDALVATWQETGRDNVESWRESGLDGDRTYFYGTFPARACVLINLGEVLVHSWDLARATGKDFALDPDLAALVHGLYSAIPLNGLRANGVLGPEVPVSADAPIADRMLGLLGRQP
jgi:uncharacterized protein (TIGR03086 family)